MSWSLTEFITGSTIADTIDSVFGGTALVTGSTLNSSALSGDSDIWGAVSQTSGNLFNPLNTTNQNTNFSGLEMAIPVLIGLVAFLFLSKK